MNNPFYNKILTKKMSIECNGPGEPKEIEKEQCSICNEPFPEDEVGQLSLCHLSCRHTFHMGCIQHWFAFHPNPTSCPLCREQGVGCTVSHDHLQPYMWDIVREMGETIERLERQIREGAAPIIEPVFRFGPASFPPVEDLADEIMPFMVQWIPAANQGRNQVHNGRIRLEQESTQLTPPASHPLVSFASASSHGVGSSQGSAVRPSRRGRPSSNNSFFVRRAPRRGWV